MGMVIEGWREVRVGVGGGGLVGRGERGHLWRISRCLHDTTRRSRLCVNVGYQVQTGACSVVLCTQECSRSLGSCFVLFLPRLRSGLFFRLWPSFLSFSLPA